MKITGANTKGGTAKTTSAAMIATVLAKAGQTIELWDADPQGSASTWAEVAEEMTQNYRSARSRLTLKQ